MKKVLIVAIGVWLGIGSGLLLGQGTKGPIPQELRERVSDLEKGENPVALLEAYEELASAYFARGYYDTALTVSILGMDHAEETGLNEQTFLLQHLAGCVFFYPKDEYQNSLVYLGQAKALADSQDIRSPYVIRNLSELAEVMNSTGDVSNAIQLQFQANKQAGDEEDWVNLAVGLRNLGVFYAGQGEFGPALNYFQEGIALIESVKDEPISDPIRLWDRSHTYYNLIASLSSISIQLSREDENLISEAIGYAEQAKQVADSIGHSYGVAYSYGLKGQIYARQQMADSALKYLELAVELYKEMDLKREWISFSISVAQQLLKINNPYRALQQLNEAVAEAEALNAPALQRDIYLMQSRVYEDLDNIDLAYRSYKRYSVLKDSLQTGSQELARLGPEQEVKQKEAEIQSLQEQTATSRRRLAIAIFIFGLLFLMVMLYLGFLRNKDLRRINRVLANKNDEIRRQNERLASSNEDLQQFAHVVSHDLREPLRSIGSFATLLQRRYQGALDRDADEFITFITAGVSRMDTLLADLMAYSVVGIFQQELERIDIGKLIQETSANIISERGTKGARINIRNLPVIEADRNQITQLFHHLIDNAIKFRSDAPPEVAIEAIQQGSYYLFSVRDNGIGMDEAYKDKIFGLFLRLHTKKSKYKGTGIGLSICKKIVEQHKGKIWIDSQIGKGTTVYFTLPESPRDEFSDDHSYFPRLGEGTKE